MTTYAHVLDGVVREIVELPNDVKPGVDVFTPEFAADLVSCPNTVQAGWSYANGTFTAPAPPSAIVPATVTAAQARIVLSRAGKLDAVKTAVTAAGGEVEIWFDYATAWERQNQHVLDLGAGIGLTSAEIDGLFTEAASIAA